MFQMKKYFSLTIFLLFFVTNNYLVQGENTFLGNTSDKKVLVKKVLKADTILLDDDRKIRLIGLNAPDAPRVRKVEYEEFGITKVLKEQEDPFSTLEEQAIQYAKSLMEGKEVRL